MLKCGAVSAHNFNKCKFNRLYQKFPLQDEKDGSKVLQNTEQYQRVTLTSKFNRLYLFEERDCFISGEQDVGCVKDLQMNITLSYPPPAQQNYMALL